MFRKIRNAILYIVASGLFWMLKHTLQLPRTSIGRISFYGPNKMGEEFEVAIKTELNKYDSVLATELLEGRELLTFIRIGKLDYYLPDMGTFFVPQWVEHHGLDSVAQYIAFCFIGSKHTGIGLNAAINISDRLQVSSTCKAAMIDWLREKNLPKQWIEYYEK